MTIIFLYTERTILLSKILLDTDQKSDFVESK